MALREILIHPDPRLKAVADPVESFDADLRRLVDDMFETMYDAPGSGLAATQIGVMRRVVVMDCAHREGAEAAPRVLINPEVVDPSPETKVWEEGCLSIPDIFADVERPDRVTVRWRDLDGTPHEAPFEGFEAVCVQHEVDHLNGRLYIDYLKPLKRQMITRKMQKLKRERMRA